MHLSEIPMQNKPLFESWQVNRIERASINAGCTPVLLAETAQYPSLADFVDEQISKDG